MNRTWIRSLTTRRRPLTSLSMLTCCALIGLALALAYLQSVIINQFQPPLVVFVCRLVAGCRRPDHHWLAMDTAHRDTVERADDRREHRAHHLRLDASGSVPSVHFQPRCHGLGIDRRGGGCVSHRAKLSLVTAPDAARDSDTACRAACPWCGRGAGSCAPSRDRDQCRLGNPCAVAGSHDARNALRAAGAASQGR